MTVIPSLKNIIFLTGPSVFGSHCAHIVFYVSLVLLDSLEQQVLSSSRKYWKILLEELILVFDLQLNDQPSFMCIVNREVQLEKITLLFLPCDFKSSFSSRVHSLFSFVVHGCPSLGHSVVYRGQEPRVNVVQPHHLGSSYSSRY